MRTSPLPSAPILNSPDGETPLLRCSMMAFRDKSCWRIVAIFCFFPKLSKYTRRHSKSLTDTSIRKLLLNQLKLDVRLVFLFGSGRQHWQQSSRSVSTAGGGGGVPPLAHENEVRPRSSIRIRQAEDPSTWQPQLLHKPPWTTALIPSRSKTEQGGLKRLDFGGRLMNMDGEKGSTESLPQRRQWLWYRTTPKTGASCSRRRR